MLAGYAVCTPFCQTGVVGATSGVGRLLVTRLAKEGVPLRAIVRDASKARLVLPATASLCEITSIVDSDTRALREAQRGLTSLFICTGTTAFPTRSWRNGNTPKAVEVVGMQNMMDCLDKNSIKRVILLSSIGTSRSQEFPFSILNLFGVLEAKREGELMLERTAKQLRFRYAIVRPGRLVGAPHTNVGMLRKDEDECMRDVNLYMGDQGTGNCSREAAAEAMLMAWKGNEDFDFSVLEKFGDRPSRLMWQEKLRAVQIGRGLNFVQDNSMM